jgi:hypothetical protein
MKNSTQKIEIQKVVYRDGPPDKLARRLGTRLMEVAVLSNITESEIAEALGSSRQWVSQLFTKGIQKVGTLAKVLDAMNLEMVITLQPKRKIDKVKAGAVR